MSTARAFALAVAITAGIAFGQRAGDDLHQAVRRASWAAEDAFTAWRARQPAPLPKGPA